jgi:osmotically-inducible protein OsmY
VTDRELQRHVEDALGWEPGIDAAHIGVTAEDGVVTLRGDIGSYSAKADAERVTLRVYGVKAVANDLSVQLGEACKRTDSAIAQAAVNALRWTSGIPADKITVIVSEGWITLRGEVDFPHQKQAATRAVRDLIGLHGVINDLFVRPKATSTAVPEKIEAALRRSAAVDARRISVTSDGGKVVLSGNVRSWAERQEVARAAWSAPGVTQVDDRLSITP